MAEVLMIICTVVFVVWGGFQFCIFPGGGGSSWRLQARFNSSVFCNFCYLEGILILHF